MATDQNPLGGSPFSMEKTGGQSMEIGSSAHVPNNGWFAPNASGCGRPNPANKSHGPSERRSWGGRLQTMNHVDPFR